MAGLFETLKNGLRSIGRKTEGKTSANNPLRLALEYIKKTCTQFESIAKTLKDIAAKNAPIVKKELEKISSKGKEYLKTAEEKLSSTETGKKVTDKVKEAADKVGSLVPNKFKNGLSSMVGKFGKPPPDRFLAAENVKGSTKKMVEDSTYTHPPQTFTHPPTKVDLSKKMGVKPTAVGNTVGVGTYPAPMSMFPKKGGKAGILGAVASGVGSLLTAGVKKLGSKKEGSVPNGTVEDQLKYKPTDKRWVNKFGTKESFEIGADRRAEARRKEVEEEKAAVRNQAMTNKDKQPGWLGPLLGMLGTVGSLISTALKPLLWETTKYIGKQMWRFAGFIGKKIWKGLGWLKNKLLDGVKWIWNKTKAVREFAGKQLTKAKNFIKTQGGKGLGFIKKQAGKITGRVAAGIGLRGASKLAGPVSVGVIAGEAALEQGELVNDLATKYYANKYKGDDVDEIMVRLRLLDYGFDPSVLRESDIEKIFKLENVLRRYVEIGYEKPTKIVNKLDKKFTKLLYKIFELDQKNEDHRKIMDSWFKNRFFPAFMAHCNAIANVPFFSGSLSYVYSNQKYLDYVGRFTDEQTYMYLTWLDVPDSVYSATVIPILPDSTTTVTKEGRQIVYKLIKDTLDVLKGDKGKAMSVKDLTDKLVNNKLKLDKQKQDAAKATDEAIKKAQTATNKPAIPTKPPTPIKEAPSPDSEGESNKVGEGSNNTKPPTGSTSIPSSTLNTAAGAVYPGDPSLTGISFAKKDGKDKLLRVHPNMFELFTGMAKEYNSLTGKSIQVNQSFRSFEDQVKMKRENGAKAATPGFSLHEKGLALDIGFSNGNADELERLGLLRKYGFTRPIVGEGWHIEPIGVSLGHTRARTDPAYATKAIVSSPGRGGGGAWNTQGRKYSRNVQLQEKIYNAPVSNPIDATKIAEKLSTVKPGTIQVSQPPTTSKVTEAPPQTSGNAAPGGSSTPTNVSFGNARSSVKDSFISNFTNTPESEGERPPSGAVVSTTADGSTPANVDVSKAATLTGEAAVRQAAKMAGVDAQSLIQYAILESDMGRNPNTNKTNANKASKARGMFQFIPETWKAMVAKYGKKYGLPIDADITNDLYSALMGAEYMKSNLKTVSGYKELGLSDTEAGYLAHHLGPGGFRSLLKALRTNPNTSMVTVVGQKVVNANPPMVNNTAAGFLAHIRNKLSKVGGRAATGGTTGSTSSYFKSLSTSTPTTPVPTPQPLQTSNYQTPAPTQQPIPQPTPPQQLQREVIQSRSMESIATDQLDKLTQIVTILTSIDGKFDPSKLAKLAETTKSDKPAEAKQPIPPPAPIKPSANSVDVTRKLSNTLFGRTDRNYTGSTTIGIRG